MQSKLLATFEDRPYWAADTLRVHPDTIFRWIAFLRGGYGAYRPCQPRRRMRRRIADKFDLPEADVELAFSEPGRNGDE